jgi:hypothetical protein
MPGKELLGVRPIEPVWVSPHGYETSNPLKLTGKPNAWHVLNQEFHASRLLTIFPFPVSDLLKPAYSFGGMPLIQMGKPYVDNWLNGRQAVADSFRESRTRVFVPDGPRRVCADAFRDRQPGGLNRPGPRLETHSAGISHLSIMQPIHSM